MTLENLENVYYIFLLLLLGCKIFLEALFEKYNPPIGHNTGIIIAIGMLLSYIILRISDGVEGGKHFLENMQFSETFFFEFALPFIVFPSGYNMRRKTFFQNIGTVSKFGIFGTMICFVVYSVGLYLVDSSGLLYKYNYET